jgi:hypothetical protein
MLTRTYCYSAGELLAIILLSLPTANASAETDPPPKSQKEFQEIEAAWKARTNQIRSLTMRVDAEEFTKGRGDKPLDNDKNNPFREPLPETGRAFKIALEFAFKQGKAALTRSGPIFDPEDPEKTSQQTLRFIFDGHECRSLCEQTGFPAMGDFEKRDSPDGPIIQNADLLGIHLWMQSREVLHAVWAQKIAMTLDEKTVEVDGVSCRRICFPSKYTARTGTLDLDPRRGWLPLQWQIWRDRQTTQLSMSLTIKYGDDAKNGPVPKGWTLTDFDPDGGFNKIRKAKVADCQINGNVDDDRFTLTFPVGTHVSERTSDHKTRQYVQKAAGVEPVDQGK